MCLPLALPPGSKASTKGIRQSANKSPESTAPRLQLREQPKTQSFKLVRVGFSGTKCHQPKTHPSFMDEELSPERPSSLY